MNPTGPNLPLRGIVYDKGDDLDHDLLSDYTMSDASIEEMDTESVLLLYSPAFSLCSYRNQDITMDNDSGDVDDNMRVCRTTC
jgi:hypothetical protein